MRLLKTFPAKDSIKLVITNEVLVVLIWPLKKEPQVTALSLHVVKSRPFLKTVNTKLFMGEKRNYKILGSLQATQNFPQ